MDLIRGAVDSRGGYVSKILHVKTKESGPVGGVHAGHAPPDPPMYIDVHSDQGPESVGHSISYMAKKCI